LAKTCRPSASAGSCTQPAGAADLHPAQWRPVRVPDRRRKGRRRGNQEHRGRKPDILKELETLLFDGVIKQRKIRHSNGQDYAYTRKMDDRALSREHELAIHIVTPLSTTSTTLPCSACRAWGATSCGVLPADVRFMQDLTMYKRTEKYIRQNSNTQQEAVKRILDAKGFQNTERLNDLQVRAKAAGQGHAHHQCGGRGCQ
jgi:hypothetical protein